MLAIKRGRHTADTPCRQPSYSCVMRTVTTPPSSKKILAHLLRVKGDFAEAAKVAGKDEKLLTRILYQARDWKGLAKITSSAGS